jgi:hypothetical protein
MPFIQTLTSISYSIHVFIRKCISYVSPFLLSMFISSESPTTNMLNGAYIIHHVKGKYVSETKSIT